MNKEELERSGKRLGNMIVGQGFVPTHILAIATGGIPVGCAIATVIPSAELFSLTKQRPRTSLKSRSPGFARMIRKIPRFATTFLRRVEHWLQYGERDFALAPLIPSAAELDKLPWPTLRNINVSRLLIVDDSVDSGVSMEFIVAAARRKFGWSTEIRTATITTTGVNPLARVDYTLFKNLNIRFFWSRDFQP